MPFLPRVRVGQTILSPAEWHLSTEVMLRNKTRLSAESWYQYIRDWRQKWDVPRYVYLVEDDTRLLLNLDNSQSLDDLSDEYRKGTSDRRVLRLQEMLPDFEETWAEGIDGRYMLEFVVPLQKRQTVTAPQLKLPHPGPVSLSERLFLPGSDWLYAKLYCGRSRQDELLSKLIPTFAESAVEDGWAERWSYIRYTDPAPHIRLRFQGIPEILLAKLLPNLCTWSQSLVANGLLRKLTLDSYEREIERYGGVEGVQIAERIFSTDSVIATDIIALGIQKVSTLAQLDLALLTVEDLLSSLCITKADRLSLYRMLRQAQEKNFSDQMSRLHKTYHTYGKTVQSIVGNRNWLYAQPGGHEMESCLRRRARALSGLGEQLHQLVSRNELYTSQMSFFASCLHMHCNRLFGINRQLEFEVAYYLGRALENLERFMPDGIRVV